MLDDSTEEEYMSCISAQYNSPFDILFRATLMCIIGTDEFDLVIIGRSAREKLLILFLHSLSDRFLREIQTVPFAITYPPWSSMISRPHNYSPILRINDERDVVDSMFLLKVVLNVCRNESKIRPGESLIWNAQTSPYRTSCSVTSDDIVRRDEFLAVGGRQERRDFVFRLLNTDKLMIEMYFDIWILGDMFENDSSKVVLSEENDLWQPRCGPTWEGG